MKNLEKGFHNTMVPNEGAVWRDQKLNERTFQTGVWIAEIQCQT